MGYAPYRPLPKPVPPMPRTPAPPGMRWARQKSPIETTTFSDERETYITRNVLVPITTQGPLKSTYGLMPCSYCGRVGAYASSCRGCGAQVR